MASRGGVPSRNAASDIARGHRHGAGIEHVVDALAAGSRRARQVSHLSISPMPLPLQQLATTLKSSFGFLRRQRHACIQAQEHQFEDAASRISREPLARTNASTSMIFGPRCQSWRDTRFGRRPHRIAIGGVGSVNSLPRASRRAPVNTRDECGRNRSRASRSQARSPSSVMPMGMSICGAIEAGGQRTDNVAAEPDLLERRRRASTATQPLRKFRRGQAPCRSSCALTSAGSARSQSD